MSAITAKPFHEMTLPELRAEHAMWVAATRPNGPAAIYENAYITRDLLVTWIARREREAGERRCA